MVATGEVPSTAADRGYSDDEIRKILAANMLRVARAALEGV